MNDRLGKKVSLPFKRSKTFSERNGIQSRQFGVIRVEVIQKEISDY
ncbi:MAG: hypothetical protein ACRDF4_02440 [Rhabdochlamydiaceae bacterium]